MVTLRPGRRGTLEPGGVDAGDALSLGRSRWDAESVEVLQPDPGALDLAEARRIWAPAPGWRAGADGPAVFGCWPTSRPRSARRRRHPGGHRRRLGEPRRQIGTTGVPSTRLYIAFGISGAAQHVSGLGAPEHIVSVNTDPHCPMTAMSHLGIVADARAYSVELATGWV